MNKTLIVLILAIVVLSWNFIFSSEKKVELTDAAKVLQGLSLAIPYKAAVRKYWQEQGRLPLQEDSLSLSSNIKVDLSHSLASSITLADDGPGVISVYFANKDTIKVSSNINGNKIMLEPFIINGKLDWSCRGTVSAALLPKACQAIAIKQEAKVSSE